MKISIVLQILAIIAAGEALKCKVCEATNREDCPGESVECPADTNSCAYGVEHSTVDGELIAVVFRRCFNHTDAYNRTMTLTSHRFKYLFSLKRCFEDNCNSGPIPRANRNTTSNGLVCKSCYTTNNTVCTQDRTIDCTGNETECSEFYGKAARPGRETYIYYFIACATAEFCQVGFDLLSGNTTVQEPYYMKCSKSLIAGNKTISE